jgi:hypothetical protein
MVHAAATVWQRCGVAGRSGLVQWQQARLPALERASCTGRVLQELSLSQPLLAEEILSAAVSNLLTFSHPPSTSHQHTRLPSLGALILLLGCCGTLFTFNSAPPDSYCLHASESNSLPYHTSLEFANSSFNTPTVRPMPTDDAWTVSSSRLMSINNQQTRC